MRKNVRVIGACGILLILAFGLWTFMVVNVDVEPLGVNGTNIGFAQLNTHFHSFTGTNLFLYNVTDWLGLVPLAVCIVFAGIGLAQLLRRRNISKVDFDILALGVHYVIVILCYLVFETIPINYRPILIDGFMEASYPSSTTLLVLGVLPTLFFEAKRRIANRIVKHILCACTVIFALFMVIARLISGVHWFTDIVGSVLLGFGLFFVFKAIVLFNDNRTEV